VATTVSKSAGVISLPSSPEQASEHGASSQGELAIIWSRFRRHHFALIGLAALFFMVLVATLAPLAPYAPNEIDRRITETQYLSHGFAPPSAAHWFGTDEHNRDMFSR
jgi:ABC-type dipeptide/oligopeptide/nickel transport system permease subunit